MSDKKNIKFTKDELESLENIQTTYRDVTAELGQLEIRKIRLSQQEDLMEQRIEALKKNFVDTQKSEKEFVSTITKKYGDGALDPQTGEYILRETSKK